MLLLSMSTSRSHLISDQDLSNNVAAAECVFAMLLCARIFILKRLVQNIPIHTDAAVARRRWVLAQVLPPCLEDDIFVTVLKAIRNADTPVLLAIVRDTLEDLALTRKDLFPSKHLFVVIDEAQVAAGNLHNYFRSNDQNNARSILREMHVFFTRSEFFVGIILSGTGLSMDVVKQAVGSVSAKPGRTQEVFVNIGSFTENDSSQITYIKRYLMLSDSYSDQRLLQRMQYWLSDR